MHCTELERPVAKKQHRCESCGETIEAGTVYVRWRCYIDGDASTNKMHPECYDMHCDDSDHGQWEYTPYSYERPASTPNAPHEGRDAASSRRVPLDVVVSRLEDEK